jgi:ligand-binding sensor domain-containing protein/signal transduction histidine kinase
MTRATILTLLFVVVAGSGIDSRGFALPNYAKRLWQAQDGLPDEIVQAFAQTSDGYLWIGTHGGLLRFDGARFVLYDRGNTPGLTESGVNCLRAARDGSLWIGTEGGGLVRYQNHLFRPYPTTDGLSNGFIRAIYEDSKGTIWVGADQGLFKVVANSIKRIDGVRGIPSMYVRAIAEDHQGRIWVGGTRLLRFEDSSVHEYPLRGGPSRNLITAMLEARDGTMWVGTLSGLFRMQGPGSLRRLPGITHIVRGLCESADGNLWIATVAGGAFVYQSGILSRMPAPAILPSNTVFDIFEDSEKDVWLGMQVGMLRLNKTPVSVIRLPGAADSEFGTIYGDRDGSVWEASTSLFRIRNGVAQRRVIAGLLDARVRTLMRDKAGDLWIGTDGDGLLHLAGKHVTRVTSQNGLTNDFVRVILQSRDGSLWIGTDGGVSHLSSKGIFNFNTHNGLSYFCVTALLEDHQGDVWIGTSRGLSHLHGDAFQSDLITESLKQEKLWSIHEDPEGGLWFGTSDGLYSFRSGKLVHYTKQQGLAGNIIYQILEDSASNFWLSGPNGVSRFNRHDLDAITKASSRQLNLTLYTTSQGLDSAEPHGGMQPSGLIDSHGEVWFPSNKGPIHILPDEGKPNLPPPLVIEQATANGEDLPVDKRIVLKPGTNRLEISYAAILLRSQQAVRYRVKLEGFDETWSNPSDRRTADYTNLPSGKYRFRVAAFEVNNPAAVSETDVEITQEPHFYGTLWFLGLCLSGVSAFIFAIHRIRMRSVHDRYLGVLDERNRVAREMHDTLIQGCTTVSALLEACSLTDGQPTRSLLDHAREQMRGIIEETRRTIWNLRNDQEASMRFDVSLQEMVGKFRRDFNLPIDFGVSGRPLDLSHEVAHELLMAMREALHNAARHSNATSIRVAVKYEAEQVAIQIIDNGCGFDIEGSPKGASLHYGIKGMSERVNRIGATLEVRSDHGIGTILNIRVPKSKSPQSNAPIAYENISGNQPTR